MRIFAAVVGVGTLLLLAASGTMATQVPPPDHEGFWYMGPEQAGGSWYTNFGYNLGTSITQIQYQLVPIGPIDQKFEDPTPTKNWVSLVSGGVWIAAPGWGLSGLSDHIVWLNGPELVGPGTLSLGFKFGVGAWSQPVPPLSNQVGDFALQMQSYHGDQLLVNAVYYYDHDVGGPNQGTFVYESQWVAGGNAPVPAWEASSPIPEPLTMLGMFLGLGSVGAYIRKRRMA